MHENLSKIRNLSCVFKTGCVLSFTIQDFTELKYEQLWLFKLYIYYLICLTINDAGGNDGSGIGIIMKTNNNLKNKDKSFFIFFFIFALCNIDILNNQYYKKNSITDKQLFVNQNSGKIYCYISCMPHSAL